MRCFIILALIAAASASCVNRVSRTYYTPTVSQSKSSSSSSSYSAPCSYGCGGYGYGCSPCYGGCGGYQNSYQSSSTTKTVEPETYTVTQEVIPCDEPEDSTTYSVVGGSRNSKSVSNSSKNDQSIDITIEDTPEETYGYDCGYIYA